VVSLISLHLDEEGFAPCPDAQLEISSLARSAGVFLDLLLELGEQDAGLLPHQRVQSADVLNIKGWGKGLALLLMHGALRKDEAEPDDAGQEIPDQPWLLKVICVGIHDIQESLVVRGQQKTPVHAAAEMDQAVVGDRTHPVQRRLAARRVEEKLDIVPFPLCYLCQIYCHAMGQDGLGFKRGRTGACGRCLKGLKAKGHMKTDHIARSAKLSAKAEMKTCGNE
jgi:hypothetical protein